MASQMLWLLSYVSLGLALTLGNRPNSIYTSQQPKQQQQQSSSSTSTASQTGKSRPEHRFDRDPTIRDIANVLRPGSIAEEQVDHQRPYRYVETVEIDEDDRDFTRNWLGRGANGVWRDSSSSFQRRSGEFEQDDGDGGGGGGDGGGGSSDSAENDGHRGERTSNSKWREISGSRENAFLVEFASAIRDTLYPRHGELRPAPKSLIIPRQSHDSRNYDPTGYAQNLQQRQHSRSAKKSRISATGQRDFTRKVTRSPGMVYRTDEIIDGPLAMGSSGGGESSGSSGKIFDLDKSDERLQLIQQRSPEDGENMVDNLPDSVDGWLRKEKLGYGGRDYETKKRGDDYGYENTEAAETAAAVTRIGSSAGNGVTSVKTLGKRNHGDDSRAGRSSSSNSRGWSSPGQQSSSITSTPGGGGIASQFLLRSARGNRQYDVPQIECPAAEDGMEKFACPTPDRMGRYRCIDDYVLCDGFIDCPTAEDEDRQACMFYKTTKAHLDVLADALLRWARSR